MTTLHITVGDRESLRDDALGFVEAAEADEPRSDRAVLQFGTYGDLVEHLTPHRLELLRTIARETPESMRAAARTVDRDVSDVHSDLKQLQVLGVVELEDGDPGGARRPVVPYDRIEVQIDYSLVEEADESPANV